MLDDLWRRPDARRALAERDVAAMFRCLQGAGISQRRIAQLTGQSQSEVSEILGGRTVTSYLLLVRIAAGFSIPRGHMGLAYVDTPIPWQQPRPATTESMQVTSRRQPQSPRHWGPVEIRALRQSMRMSVREFAAYLGVSDRMVSKWEAGATPRPVDQEALDTALARASHEARARFAGWPTHTAPAGASLVNGSRWVVHLPLRAPNLAAALTLAETVALAAEHLPQIVTTDIAVSANGREFERFPVFCDRILPTGQPCAGRSGHQGPCPQQTKGSE